MDRDELRRRTKTFALRIIRLVGSLSRGPIGDVIGRQVFKAGTAVGANYREALRAWSKKHFASIIEIALREADETLYWLELLAESGSVKPILLADLRQEADELVAILASTAKTSRNTL